MQIGLLQCDHVHESFQHILTDYDVAFKGMFQKYAPNLTFRVYDVCHGELPESVNECEGYLITGSAHSVYDDIEWIHDLAEFVRQAHAQQHKMVGICFGHQMIAHALGGKVAKADGGWGIGIKTADINQTKDWMQPTADAYQLLLSHQDQVLNLPDGGESLAGNEHCPVSMFMVKNHMLGIQAHPEFTPDYAKALMDSREERIGQEAIQQATITLDSGTDEKLISEWINTFFRKSDA